MAETPKTEPKVEAPVSEPKAVEPQEEELVEVELSTRFITNGESYGQEPMQDANGDIVYTTVRVPKSIAEDLKRRQREYDRSERERFTMRKFGRFSGPME